MFASEVVALFEELWFSLRLVHAWAHASRMGTVLQNIFGKGKNNYGDVEFWHGAERAGWLMKQGGLSAPLHAAPAHASSAQAEASVAGVRRRIHQDLATQARHLKHALANSISIVCAAGRKLSAC